MVSHVIDGSGRCWIRLGCALLLATACGVPKSPLPPADAGAMDTACTASEPAARRTLVTLGPSTPDPKLYPPGTDPLTPVHDVLRLMAGIGADLFVVTPQWQELETLDGSGRPVYNLQHWVQNPIGTLLAQHPEVRGVAFVIKVIDTNVFTAPSDLVGQALDAVSVRMRFGALLDQLLSHPAFTRVTHVLIGNEIDALLMPGGVLDMAKTIQFKALLESAIVRIKTLRPEIRVGTIITAAAARARPDILSALNENTDFITFTYYPATSLSNGNVSQDWQMKANEDVAADLNALLALAPNRPIALTEIGSSSEPLNGSSLEMQRGFVQTMFHTLDQPHREGRVEFLAYNNVYGSTADQAQRYAKEQGIAASPEFIAFMSGLSLRGYADNKPKPSWDEFGCWLQAWRKVEP